MNGFDWDRAKTRKEAGITSAAAGNPKEKTTRESNDKSQNSKELKNPQPKMDSNIINMPNRANSPINPVIQRHLDHVMKRSRKNGTKENPSEEKDDQKTKIPSGFVQPERYGKAERFIVASKEFHAPSSLRRSRAPERKPITAASRLADSEVQDSRKYSKRDEDPVAPSSRPPPTPVEFEQTYLLLGLPEFASTSAGAKVEPAKITGCEYAGSYNWLNSKAPTVVIPGAPPIWTPLPGPHQLKEDTGPFFRDQNSARWPKYPIEPAVRAMFDYNPDLDTYDIDIVMCAGVMGNIFKFASGHPWNFRFDMQRVGRTIFMIRKEDKPDEIIDGIYGYGHAFPEANTTWDPAVKDSVSNQRIIRYNFAGLNLMVRFEADGFLPSEAPDYDEPFEIVDNNVGSTDIDPLVKATESLGIVERPGSGYCTIKTMQAGSNIPQKAIIDIKTRHENNEIDIATQVPRLWARQITKLALAYHEDGLFGNRTKVHDLTPIIDKWETKYQTRLAVMGRVLKKLVAECRTINSVLEVLRAGKGPLIVQHSTNLNNVLPDDLSHKWNMHAFTVKRSNKDIDEKEWDILRSNGKGLLLEN